MIAAHVLSSAEAFIRRVEKKLLRSEHLSLTYLFILDRPFRSFQRRNLRIESKETRGGGGESKSDATTIDADDRSKGGRGRGEEGVGRGGGGKAAAYEILLTQPAKPDTFKLNIYLLIDGRREINLECKPLEIPYVLDPTLEIRIENE